MKTSVVSRSLHRCSGQHWQSTLTFRRYYESETFIHWTRSMQTSSHTAYSLNLTVSVLLHDKLLEHSREHELISCFGPSSWRKDKCPSQNTNRDISSRYDKFDLLFITLKIITALFYCFSELPLPLLFFLSIFFCLFSILSWKSSGLSSTS